MLLSNTQKQFYEYAATLANFLQDIDFDSVERLAKDIKEYQDKKVFICGNGGSAANASHICNDLVSCGIDIFSLSCNQAVLTCIANDDGYEHVFSKQLLKIPRNPILRQVPTLLIVLSGSGNSKNIILALKKAKELKMLTWAIVGYDGGEAKKIADNCLHFNINDMQIAEDCQLIVGHMIMRYLCK